MKRICLISLAIVLVIALVSSLSLVGCASSPEEEDYGSVMGEVTDTAGNPLGDVTISVAGESGVTNEQGWFSISNVAAGVDQSEAEVVDGLVRRSIKVVFDEQIPLEGVAPVVESFDQGWKVEVSSSMPAAEYLEGLEAIPGLREAAARLAGGDRSFADRHHVDCQYRCVVEGVNGSRRPGLRLVVIPCAHGLLDHGSVYSHQSLQHHLQPGSLCIDPRVRQTPGLFFTRRRFP